MTPTIVFDFDGTIAIGSGPVMAYAREVARAAADAALLERIEVALAAFESGDTRYRDGYDVVGSLAEQAGVDAAARAAAYDASRAQLGSELAPVEPVPGLAELLDALRSHARLVLATNAPASGIEPLLERWGVRDGFDELRFAVGKPAGLDPLIREALAAGPVLAIGDIVEYDLAPAMALGASTALVGATAAHSTANVTMRALTLAELRDDIETWAATAASEDPASNGAATPIER
ncbi:MAG: HAD family hydrolase [Microbacteriaceae bacterium]|nr:MAG: HAD family hydrolase [Microbacteriaceae bacterium]